MGDAAGGDDALLRRRVSADPFTDEAKPELGACDKPAGNADCPDKICRICFGGEDEGLGACPVLPVFYSLPCSTCSVSRPAHLAVYVQVSRSLHLGFPNRNQGISSRWPLGEVCVMFTLVRLS
jgi:hypothetical protein